eukprot:11537232-Heterocapsa_arctica.AAC.1
MGQRGSGFSGAAGVTVWRRCAEFMELLSAAGSEEVSGSTARAPAGCRERRGRRLRRAEVRSRSK